MANYKKIIKITLLSMVGIIIIGIAGVAGIVTLVNPNHFKPMIIKAAYEGTGRKLTLAGDISWTIYPNLGLKIQQVSLSNPTGFKSKNMLELNSADVSVALLPLLNHKIIFKNLAVDGLKLGLIKQGGVNNWTFTPATIPSKPSKAGKKPPLHIEFNSLSLNNSSINYDDFDNNKHRTVKNINFNVDTGFGGEVKLDTGENVLNLNKVSFNYDDAAIGKLNLKVSDLDNPRYKGNISITKLMLNKLLDNFGIDLGTHKKMPLLDNISFSGIIDGDKKNIKLDNFDFNFANTLKGKINLALKNLKNPSYIGNIDLDEFNLNKVLNQANIAVTERKDKPLLNKAAFSSKFDGTKNDIDLNSMEFKLGSIMSGSGNVQIQNFAKPTFAGSINLPDFPLNQVLDGLNIAKAARQNKPLLNNNLAFSSRFNGAANSITLNGFSFDLGKIISGSGNVQVQNFDNPTFGGNINLPQFELNKVLNGLNIAVSERKDKPLLNTFALNSRFNGTKNSIMLNEYSFKAGGILQGSGSKFAVQNFDNPKFSGDVSLPTFSLNQVMAELGMSPIDIPHKERLDQVVLKTGFAGSKTNLNLSQLYFKFSNSTLTGNANISSFKPLALAENINIDQLDVSDFSNVNGFKVPLRQIHVIGNSSINNNRLATLNGKQSVQIGNVALLGFSLDEQVHYMDQVISSSSKNPNVAAQIGNAVQINQAMQKVRAKIAQATSPGAKDFSKTTNLGSFSSDAVFYNGAANPSSFRLNGPSLSMNGNGTLNLGQKTLNYKVNTKLLVSGINPVFKKLTFPAQVQGAFANPSAGLDWGSIIQQLAAYALANGKAQIENAVKNQINQTVGNKVRQTIGDQNGNKVIDGVGKAAANAIGGLFGGKK